MENITLVIDNDTLLAYEKHYFSVHTKAKKKPIKQPYHESINVWMIMKRAMMNSLKQKWKDFIKWFVDDQGYTNLSIDECVIEHTVFYPNDRRHDTDNSDPKFIMDGLVESGMIVDDDCKHVRKLILQCFVDRERPRTEIKFSNIKYKENNNGK